MLSSYRTRATGQLPADQHVRWQQSYDEIPRLRVAGSRPGSQSSRPSVRHVQRACPGRAVPLQQLQPGPVSESGRVDRSLDLMTATAATVTRI